MTNDAPEDITQQAKSHPYGYKATLTQCFATFVVGITFFRNGLFTTVPTVVVGNLLNSKHDSLSLNEEQASWFASLPFLLQPIGALAGVLLQDFVGQRYSLYISHALASIFYLMLYCATSTSTILLSGVLMGLSQGFTEPSTMSYISEFSEARLRGYLSSGAFSMMSFGMLFEFIVISIVDWRTALLINAVVPIFALLLLPWMPDSPIWLLSKGEKTKASESLAWFRGCLTTSDVQEEFQVMDAYVQSSLEQSHIIVEYDQDERSSNVKKSCFGKFLSNVTELFANVFERRTLYPLLLLSCIHTIFLFSGSIGARIYSMNLFDTLQTPIDKHWLTISYSVANVAGSTTVLLILKYTGKRKLAIFSFLLASSMSLCIGIYVHFKEQLQLPWLFIPLFFTLVYITSQGIGIPWLLMGEIFPVRTRNAGSGLFGVILDLLLFSFIKTYFAMNRFFGTVIYFVIHGLIGIGGTFLLYLYMPETEGKSLAEIEEIFSKK